MEVKSNYDIQADKCKLEFIKMCNNILQGGDTQ